MRTPLTPLLSAAFLLGIGCPVRGAVEIIAHRGEMMLAPENTLAAQRLAYELGADIVECDARLVNDSVPVIMHDPDLDRTTNAARADIRRFQAAGFEVSHLYSNPLYAFIYEDGGLNSFWTEYPEVTVPRKRRTSQEWANWADVAGLGPDQRRTWQDADGDGVSNLIEYTPGTDPLQPDRGPAPVPGFQILGTPAGSPTATSLDWTVDLRENWSEFLNVTPQSKAGSGVWTNIPASCCTTLTPSQLLFKFPVGIGGSKFFRLKFDLKW